MADGTVQGQGFKAILGVMVESTWGTAVTSTSGNYNRMKTIAIKPKGSQTSGVKNLGVAWASQQRVHQRRAEGTISFDMHYQGYERLLWHLFGTKASGTVVDSSYTHTFTPSIARQTGLTLSVQADLLEMRYPGMKINKATFNFKRNDPMEITLGVIGKPPADTTSAQTGTFMEDVAAGNSCLNPIETDNGFKFYTGTAGSTATDEIGIIDSSLNIDIPMQQDRGNVGVATIAEPIPNGSPLMSITGSLKKEFLGSSFIDYFLNGTQKSMKWTYKSSVRIGSTTYWEATIEAKYVRFLESPPEISGPGPIEDSIPFVCESPDGSTAPLTMVLVNKLASIT